ncbi:MAG TPA: hypothetical protein VF952_19055 [Chloroflexia bacterium]|jgi:hypothetical protein
MGNNVDPFWQFVVLFGFAALMTGLGMWLKSYEKDKRSEYLADGDIIERAIPAEAAVVFPFAPVEGSVTPWGGVTLRWQEVTTEDGTARLYAVLRGPQENVEAYLQTLRNMHKLQD